MVLIEPTALPSVAQGGSSLRAGLWSLLPRAELAAAFYVLAIAASVHGFVDVILYANGGDVVTDVSFVSRVAWPLAYLMFAVLVGLHLHDVQNGLARAGWVALFSLCAILSIAWSDDTVVTAKGALRLAMTTLIGAYLGARFTPLKVLQLLFWVLLVSVAASVLVGMAELDFARMLSGAVRGLFYHKNSLGNRSALLLAVCLTFLCVGERPLLALVGTLVAVLALILAESGTSLLAAAAAAAASLFVLFRGDTLEVAFRLAIGAAAAILVTFLLLWWRIDLLTETLELLGKDMSFTGRIMLWAAAVAQFHERPLLGIGFDAFWNGAVDTRTFLVLNIMGHGIANFHNTYLEIAVQLGALGLVTAAVMLLCFMWLAIAYLTGAPNRIGIGPILVLTVMFVTTLAEYDLFAKHNLSHILFVALAVGMAKELRSARPPGDGVSE